jgi:hypothetical protein
MSDCKYLADCPVFARFTNAGAGAVWVELFCRNDFVACERLKLRQAGAQVPETLLPNGTYLVQST